MYWDARRKANHFSGNSIWHDLLSWFDSDGIISQRCHTWLAIHDGEPPWMPTCWTIPALMVHIHGHDEPLAPLLAMVAPAVVPCQWSLVWLHQMEGILGHPLELGPLGILHPWVGVHPCQLRWNQNKYMDCSLPGPHVLSSSVWTYGGCELPWLAFVSFCKPLLPLLHPTSQCGFCWLTTCGPYINMFFALALQWQNSE